MSAERLPPDGYELGPGWRDTGTLPAPNVWKCMADVGDWRCCGLIAPYRNGGNGACRVHAEAMGAIVRKAEAPTTRANGGHVPFCSSGSPLSDVPCPICGAEENPKIQYLGMDGKPYPTVSAPPPPEQPSGNAGGSTPRCEVCDWPLARSRDKGCVPGDCSYRPEDPRELAKLSARRAWIAAGRPPEVPAAPVAEPVEARHLAHAFVTANRLDCEKERPSPEPRPEHFPLCDRLTDVIQRAIDPRDARIVALEAELAARLVERDGWMQAAAKSEREKAALAAALEAARGYGKGDDGRINKRREGRGVPVTIRAAHTEPEGRLATLAGAGDLGTKPPVCQSNPAVETLEAELAEANAAIKNGDPKP